MNKEQKNEEVDRIRDLLSDAQLVVLTEYSGLDVSSMVELRRALRQSDASYRIMKNTLAKLATADTGMEVLRPYFVGPIGVASTHNDPAACAKALLGFVKDHNALKIKAGFLGGKFVEPGGVEALSKLPGRDDMRAMLLGALNGVARSFVSVLAAGPRSFVGVLDARRRQLDDE